MSFRDPNPDYHRETAGSKSADHGTWVGAGTPPATVDSSDDTVTAETRVLVATKSEMAARKPYCPISAGKTLLVRLFAEREFRYALNLPRAIRLTTVNFMDERQGRQPLGGEA